MHIDEIECFIGDFRARVPETTHVFSNKDD